jgi:DNA-binding NtrC family response regulator
MLEVLVVEDDEIVRSCLSEAITGAGHRVREASDGEQAVTLLANHAFDVALCDVQLPKMDGLTLLRRMRRESPDTAVVIMTSHGRISDVVDSMRDGAVDYVVKPFDTDEFVQKVLAPIAERRERRHMPDP